MSLQMNGFSSQVPNKGLHSTGLHKSTVVQVTPLHLAQSITGEKAHCPSETEQVSAVHALPSVHDFIGWAHPVIGSHVSAVQEFPSSH